MYYIIYCWKGRGLSHMPVRNGEDIPAAAKVLQGQGHKVLGYTLQPNYHARRRPIKGITK